MKTIVSAAIVGVALAGQRRDNQFGLKSDVDKAGNFYDKHSGAIDGAITTAATVGKILANQNDNQFGVKQDLDKAGDFYNKHSGAIDGAITTAATVGKILANQNDNQLGLKQDLDKAGDFYSNHSGAIDSAVTTAATVGKILANQNDNEFGVKQRAEFVAKHGSTIAKIAGMLGDENEFDLKQDADKAGDFYSNHSGAIDSAITTAAKVGKILANQNDNEFGIKQRAEFVAKHGSTIAKIAGMFGDENDNELDLKTDLDKAGNFVDKHQKAIETGAKIAGAVATIAADEDVDDYLLAENRLASLKGLESRTNERKFLSF